MVPDGVISPAQSTFRYLHQEDLQALLKPVSQVRILPGAQVFLQFRHCFAEMPKGPYFIYVLSVVAGLLPDSFANPLAADCSELGAVRTPWWPKR
jgi:hypothetical protein